MKGDIRATIKINGIQREHRFVKGTPKRIIKAWQISEKAKLQKQYPAQTDGSTDKRRGTLKADAVRYYPLIMHLADWVTRRSEIRAWLKAGLADRFRHTITREDILTIIGIWRTQKRPVAAKTVNNRVTALRNLYQLLDGDEAPTPCDGIKPLPFSKVPPTIITADVVNTVAWTLAANPRKHAAADRGRLMILASTGKRPCEIERAEPDDVDLLRRVWAVRDAKGGWGEGIYLNDEMIIAWQAFIEAEAWGKFPDHFPRRLRDAGWPNKVKPYNMRHSTWITASERGTDLADIQAGAGHKHISTTRIHYVPVLNSRMQRLSERLEGRFAWASTVSGAASLPTRNNNHTAAYLQPPAKAKTRKMLKRLAG